ncbi:MULTISPECIES: hypothetical protein [Mycolicibacterium]|uniref:hypothetical protein n=3 Tax=Mycolicibacterium TaxID=1866885 RepID=UPI001CA30602|nr:MULTISPECIES: hypothetical protein [Mycolicibacterium]QZT56272.1 hypothetical protein JN084_25680 [Mycolicibacterium austroafricanum]WND55915.1 hypothetical protein QQA43_24905 [Mycolicibacterium vanbaalenii]
MMFDMVVLLLFRYGWTRRTQMGPVAEWRREKQARRLSSYNNNSNNPQRGTDRLRGAW